MSPMASQITSIAIVYLTVYSGADQRKHQIRVTGLCERNSLHKGPVMRKIIPFDDVIKKDNTNTKAAMHTM